jgi:hypothetical protein
MVIDKKTLIIAGIVILIVILMRIGCGGGGGFGFGIFPPPENIVIRDTIETVKWDTIDNSKTDTAYIPKIIEKRIIDIREIPQNIDTGAILQEFYSTNIYIDTLIHTDSIKFVIYDTVSQNSIISRSFRYNILYPTITETITEKTVLNRREVYLGGELGFGLGQQITLDRGGLSLLFRTKRNVILGLDGGLNHKLQPTIGVGVYYKINLRKKK